MKIIVIKQNTDGSYDQVGMNNRSLFSEYKTLHNAIKYGAKMFANGNPCKVEVYPVGIYEECNWVLFFDAKFNRVI
jgi:hypothetical protein